MATPSFKYIYLTQGRRAKVSPDDYEMLREYQWRLHTTAKGTYAKACIKKLRPDGVTEYRSTVLMHRLITGAKDGLVVDHENRNGLDNRRENLKVCTQGENLLNRQYGVVKYRGVTRSAKKKQDGQWSYRARITNKFTDKQEYLGTFITDELAAHAFDKRAIELYGPYYAGLNFTREQHDLQEAISHEPEPEHEIPF